jgi:hypothetical protein
VRQPEEAFMIAKISTMAASILITSWYEEECEDTPEEAAKYAKEWLESKDEEFLLGFCRIFRKADGLYIGQKEKSLFDDWLRSLDM